MAKGIAEKVKREEKEPRSKAKSEPRVRAKSRVESNPIARYFNELRIEWSKVTLPGKKELVQSTIVVFFFSILVTAVIAVYDMLVTFVFSFLFGWR